MADASLDDWGSTAATSIVRRAAYCQAYGRWAEAERKLKETPMLLKFPSGIIRQSPWLAIANKQLELMSKFMSELGLSPVSRTRVEVKPLGGAPVGWA
jgi:P27 family predicted phage terminase small subunit